MSRNSKLKEITFILNGNEIKASVFDARKTLLSFLRDELGLTGTKKGCGVGDCGSCAVIINGKARRSCIVKMANLDGTHVETIEGLSQNGQLHPVQLAFLRAGAVQCGFCTPGLIMASKNLLDRIKHPTDEEIKDALKDHICRCTGYTRIIEAVHLAADGSGENETIRADGGVGKDVLDIEGEPKVRGKLLFADDYREEPFLAGKILWSQHPHARILEVETSRAKAMPGVRAVLTASDIPGLNGIGFSRLDQPVLAQDRVRWVGDAIAAVFAETAEQAEAACEALEVEYEPLPVLSSLEDALSPHSIPLHPGGNVMEQFEYASGQVDRSLSDSHLVVSGRFTTPFVEHAYLETEAVWAKMEENDSLTLITCTQYPFEVRKQASDILKLDELKVRVVVTPLGGAFGGKTDMHPCIPIAALGALKTCQPVKISLERSESIQSSTKRHAFVMHYKIGLDQQGQILGVDADLLMDAGPYTGQSEWVLEQACIFACGPYRISNVRVRGRGVYTNNAKGGAFRGFGINQPAFAMESLLDEAARRLNLDPLELRIRNALQEGDVTPAGERLAGAVGAKATLNAALPVFADRVHETASRRGWKRGVGIATAYKNVGWGRGAVDSGSALIRLEKSGGVTVMALAPDMGQGIRTGLYQIVKQVLGVNRQLIEMRLLDTSLLTSCHGGAGERLTFCTGNAVLLAATHFREKLLMAAETLFGLPAKDLAEMSDGVLHYQSEGRSSSVTFEEIAQKLEHRGDASLEVKEVYTSPKTYGLESRGNVDEKDYRLYPAYSYTTTVAVVEVNELLGKVEVTDLHIFQDVGKAINPLMIEGQLQGSCLQALGYALKEEYRIQEGVPQDLTFKKLGVPRIWDAPHYHCTLIETMDPHGPFGAKGISEVATIPTAPAIVNAIRDATGTRVYSLPAKMEKIRAIHDPSRGKAHDA